jgi:RNA polymerase sigma-70 factor (ECF subfamily)
MVEMSDPGLNQKLGELFSSYHPEVLGYCARRVGRGDAEDAAAEVFAIASRRAGEIDWSTARPWLFGIARGVIANRWRSLRRWNRAAGLVNGMATLPQDGPDEVVIRYAEDQEVLTTLRAMTATDQEVLMLAEWEELSSAEIAHALGISVAAADQRLHRARDRFVKSFLKNVSRVAYLELPVREAPDGK